MKILVLNRAIVGILISVGVTNPASAQEFNAADLTKQLGFSLVERYNPSNRKMTLFWCAPEEGVDACVNPQDRRMNIVGPASLHYLRTLGLAHVSGTQAVLHELRILQKSLESVESSMTLLNKNLVSDFDERMEEVLSSVNLQLEGLPLSIASSEEAVRLIAKSVVEALEEKYEFVPKSQ